MISAPEAARYPFFAQLSGCRNEIGIGDRFWFSGARGRGSTHEHSSGYFERKSCHAAHPVLRLSRPSRAGPV